MVKRFCVCQMSKYSIKNSSTKFIKLTHYIYFIDLFYKILLRFFSDPLKKWHRCL